MEGHSRKLSLVQVLAISGWTPCSAKGLNIFFSSVVMMLLESMIVFIMRMPPSSVNVSILKLYLCMYRYFYNHV